MVSMMQLTFRKVNVQAELTWNNTILHPKGKGDYRVIVLVEVI